VEEGDPVSIDVDRREINLEVPPEKLRERLARWQTPAPHYTTGVFAKYCALVASASEGAVTSKF
jgi:dihydroxy-acid dehydratase